MILKSNQTVCYTVCRRCDIVEGGMMKRGTGQSISYTACKFQLTSKMRETQNKNGLYRCKNIFTGYYAYEMIHIFFSTQVEASHVQKYAQTFIAWFV